MKHFINLKDISIKDLRKILADDKKRKHEDDVQGSEQPSIKKECGRYSG